ncbi:MAG: low molecular weight protein arginine phosphatase [Candidatus Limiplasma sp.]|nr:low molecular weight protein arginine phosphatase [Candidatus Limiplasma sp.]MEA5144824.1 low molecular weight protein arginine phosphatase [Candidatus Limiplasma sp.]
MIDVLFVCTGNTCRSPMAMAIFNAMCVERGLPYRAESAGVQAMEGTPASDGAFDAMKERGLSLARHVAQPFTPMAAREARLVVAMSAAHAQVIRQRYPQARVLVFDPPIRDPFGGSIQQYRATADELQQRMEWVLAELQKLDGM